MNDDLLPLVEACVAKIGAEKFSEACRRMLEDFRPDSVLTIVANKGVHHLPDDLMRGQLFALSEGSLDFSSGDSVKGEFESRLRNLAFVLRSQSWSRIYLVPFGPTLLSAYAKLLVFRVTGLETIDVMHMGRGAYTDISLDLRALVLEADAGN